MVVREAQHQDLDQIVALWSRLMAHHQPLNPRLYQTEDHSQATYRTFVGRQVNSDIGLVLVVEDDGRIAGFLLGSQGRRSPVYAVRTVGMIYDLVVHPSHRRKGLGRALVEHAQSAFLASGIDDIQVNYDPKNSEACSFWQSLGYETLLVEAYRSTRPSDQSDSSI